MSVDKLKWTIIIICIIFIALAILAVLSWNNRRSSDGTAIVVLRATIAYGNYRLG